MVASWHDMPVPRNGSRSTPARARSPRRSTPGPGARRHAGRGARRRRRDGPPVPGGFAGAMQRRWARHACGSTSRTWRPEDARPIPRAVAIGSRGGRRWRRPRLARGRRARVGGRQVARRPDGARWPWPKGCRPPASSSWATRSTRPASPTGSATSICYGSRFRCSSCRARRPSRRPDLLAGGDRELGRPGHAAPDRGRRPLVQRSRRETRTPREVGAVARAVRRAVRSGTAGRCRARTAGTPSSSRRPTAPPRASDAPLVGAGARVRHPPDRRREGVPLSRGATTSSRTGVLASGRGAATTIRTPVGTGTPNAGAGSSSGRAVTTRHHASSDGASTE